jgi:hypothetical protein
MKQLFITLVSILVLCCCTPGKEQGELFCSKEMLAKTSGCSIENFLNYSEFIKVGQTFTFRKVNYEDKLSMPIETRIVEVKVTFNGDNTIIVEDNVGHKYHNKVKIAWAESFSFVFEEGIKGTAYKVLFNLDNGNGEFLEMFRQKPGSGYGRNEYGIRFKTHNSLYFTGPNTGTLYPFDY